MKVLWIITIAFSLCAGGETKEGFERSVKRDKREACEAAKALARERHEIVKMNPGCTCERTDGREWLCDVRFTYRVESKK
jgi:hypothetical protein